MAVPWSVWVKLEQVPSSPALLAACVSPAHAWAPCDSQEQQEYMIGLLAASIPNGIAGVTVRSVKAGVPSGHRRMPVAHGESLVSAGSGAWKQDVRRNT